MTRRSRFTLFWIAIAALLGALVIPLTPIVYRALVEWGWLDPNATTGGDPFGKVLRRLLLVPIAVIVFAVFRPFRDQSLGGMGLRGPLARPHAGVTGFAVTLGVILAMLAVHVALGWLVVQVTESPGRVGYRVVKTLLEALLVATIENWFFRAWLPGVLARRIGARPADLVAIVVFAAIHAFKPSNLDIEVSHDAAGAWEALKSWTSTMVDPAEFGPAFVGLALFATLLTVAYRRSRTLWLPIGIHAAGIWALLAHGAFTERLARPWWAGSKILYDGAPGWIVLLLAALWVSRWERAPDPAPAPSPEPLVVP